MVDKKIISVVAVIIIALIGGIFGTSALSDSDTVNNTTAVDVIESGQYVTAPEVAAYIKEYHKLPSNYITKKEAQQLGWQGGPLKSYAPLLKTIRCIILKIIITRSQKSKGVFL